MRAILLVDHGSRRAEANAQLEALAAQVSGRIPDAFVAIAHLEIAEPSIAAGIAACVQAGADEVVVHPYFLGPGSHTQSDIPEQVERARAGHPDLKIQITPPLGLHPHVLEAVLDRLGGAEPS